MKRKGLVSEQANHGETTLGFGGIGHIPIGAGEMTVPGKVQGLNRMLR